MNQNEFKKILAKYAHQSCSPSEKELVERYFEKLQEQEKNVPLSELKQKALLQQITKQLPKAKQRRIPSFLKIAASIIFLLGVYAVTKAIITPTNSFTIVSTKDTERSTLTLPDGSVIQLNGGTSVAYHDDFENNRIIKLDGEAFFEVAKDSLHPFQIFTDTVTTTVLGTSFNINAYKGQQFSVHVRTGKVKVNYTADTTSVVYLLPNQSALATNATLVKANENFNQYVGWLDNTIIFKKTNLQDVAKILQHWYGVTIVFDDALLKTRAISGKFKNEKLDTVLESIMYLENLTYEYQNKNQIIIKSIH